MNSAYKFKLYIKGNCSEKVPFEGSFEGSLECLVCIGYTFKLPLKTSN